MSTCRLPLPPLLDYWFGELTPGESAEIEEHLFGCNLCTDWLTWVTAVDRGVERTVRGGRVPLLLTRALIERLERDGVRIRHYRVPAGGSVQCTAGPGDDLVAMWLMGEFQPAERVDLMFVGAPAALPERRDDIPVDHARGEAVFVERGDVIRQLPPHVATIRLVGVGDAGERPIGEYTLHHMPWPA